MVKRETKNEFADARAIMAKHFQDKSPNGVRATYIANITMLLYDRLPKCVKKKERVSYANYTAERLLKIIFE